MRRFFAIGALALGLVFAGTAAAQAGCHHNGPRVGVNVGYGFAAPPVRYVAAYPPAPYATAYPPAPYVTNYPAYNATYYAPPPPVHACRPAYQVPVTNYYAPQPTYAAPAYGPAYYNSGLTLTFGR